MKLSEIAGKPVLADLFCGQGGAARGYQQAGFFVIGVDLVKQPRYAGDLFVQADALNPPFDLSLFDVIHASPPCQAYSSIAPKDGRYPDLYECTRQMLEESGKPWVIENVIGAPVRAQCCVGLCLG